MEDNLSFIHWMESLVDSTEDVDISGLSGAACPAGAVKTGIFLDEDQKATLALLRWQVGIASKLRQAYEQLTPADQKVKPFHELLVQCERCSLLSQSLNLSVMASVTPRFYGFVGVGFDNNFEIWVGPGQRQGLGDLPNLYSLYSYK